MVSSNNIKMKILFKGKKNYDRSKRFLLMSAEVALSIEETDHLIRNTKKQKATSKPFSPQIPILSCKDSVLRPSFDWEDLSAQNLPLTMKTRTQTSNWTMTTPSQQSYSPKKRKIRILRIEPLTRILELATSTSDYANH